MGNLLPYDIWYENSSGERLCLSQVPYMLTAGQLFDGRWKLNCVSRPMGEGQRLVRARRSPEERTVTIKVAAASAKELSELLEYMSRIFDCDIAAMKPGKLWVNDRYMTCWCSARQKEMSCDFISNASVVVTVVPEYPVWCSESTVRLGDTLEKVNSGVTYPYSYPYRYGGGRQGTQLSGGLNERPMRITFFGPAKNPSVYINGRQTGVRITLAKGEKAVIDQRSRTVSLIRNDGSSENIFDCRIKNGFTFVPLEASGGMAISDSEAVMEITLIDQRSEPEWALS